MATSGYERYRCGITLKLRLCARRNSFRIANNSGVECKVPSCECPNMYGPPSDCKEKAEGEKTSLRKCIRPLVELSAPGQDELRAYLAL